MFGLEQFEDPSFRVPVARPVWSRHVLVDTLTAHIDDDAEANARDRIDLRQLAQFVTIVIDDDDNEHILLSDGRHFLRIDVVVGTLIGCPSSLTYLVRGLTQLQGPLRSLKRLATLVSKGVLESDGSTTRDRQKRWIAELRVADALQCGQDHQSIARCLFGPMVSASRWRTESAAYRSRVQRLAVVARHRLEGPISF